jgi:hypothetical protein
VLWAVGLAGLAAAVSIAALAATSETLPDPGIRASLAAWITLPYIFGGLLAWWRRPDSRFGPLMVAAGFAGFLSTLTWSGVDGVFTIGQAFDLLPAVLFLHVFLAYPSGRLDQPFERALVITGYATAFGLQLVGMTLGGFGPGNLLAVVAEAGAADTVLRAQLVVISALCLIGVGVLAARRRAAGPPLRRSLALLIDSFALGLLMIAVLFMSHVLEGPAIEPIRWAAFAIIGLAPLAFLLGLARARLARTTVGDLFLELRADPAPADLRDALGRALRILR